MASRDSSHNGTLRATQRRLLEEREQERKHLARELHDQVIQDLLGIGYQIEGALSRYPTAPPAMCVELTEMQERVRTLIEGLRCICNDLRPPALDSLGLSAAISSHVYAWSRQHAISVSLDLDPHLVRLPETTELSIFRIVQEGLNNVWQHAHATEVAVTLRDTSHRLRVSVADDGCGVTGGFDVDALTATSHFGLVGVRERVALMGGHMAAQNRPGGGFLLLAEIPLG